MRHTCTGSSVQTEGQAQASCVLLQVFIAQCDAHDIFRNVQDVRGIVVLLRRSTDVPMPHQLAISLRNKQSFEND